MTIPDASTQPERATKPDELRQTFEALALPHLAHLYRLAARLAGHGRDAEDLVHETYVKGLAAFPNLREQASIRGWLSRILARLAIDRHRPRGGSWRASSRPWRRAYAVRCADRRPACCSCRQPFSGAHRPLRMVMRSSVNRASEWVLENQAERSSRSRGGTRDETTFRHPWSVRSRPPRRVFAGLQRV